MSICVEEEENSEIDRFDEPAPRSTVSKKMLVVAVTLILIISIIGVAFVAGLFSEPEPQYETMFEEHYTYDGGGMWYEDRFFWLSWSPDGTHLTSYMGFSRVAIWDITSEPVSELEPHELPLRDPEETATYYDIEYHPIDDVIAVGWHQGIAFFDSEWNLLSEIRGGEARSIAWKPRGNVIAVSWVDHETGDNSLQTLLYPDLLNLSYRNLDTDLDVLEWSPNGAFLAGCSGGGRSLYVFNTHLYEQLHIPKYYCGFSMSWSPDSSTLLVIDEGEVVFFDWESVEEKHVKPKTSERKYCGSDKGFGGQESAASAAFSPSGDMVAVAYSSGIVRIWSGDGKKLLDSLLFRPCVNHTKNSQLYTVRWSSSGEMVAVSGEHGITVWKSK